MRAPACLLMLAAGVCVVLVACWGGGDGRLSEEEYFERVASLLKSADEAIAADDAGDPTVVDGEDLLRQQADHYELVGAAYASVGDQFGQLNPPPGFSALNDDLSEAFLEYSARFVAFADYVRGVPGTGIGLEFTTDPGRVRALCGELEAGASSRQVEVELSCAIYKVALYPSHATIESDTAGIVPDFVGRLAEMPPLPEGLVAISKYIDFEVEGQNSPTAIGLPLEEAVDDASGLAFYVYEDGGWVRLNVELDLVPDAGEGQVAQADFDSVPASLAVLREE